MFGLFNNGLRELDRNILGMESEKLVHELQKIPLEKIAELYLSPPGKYKNIIEWLPQMPSIDIQKKWTGNANVRVMNQSVAFIQTVMRMHNKWVHDPIVTSNVLDFGCGWGRLIRLLYRYVPVENIYGVDPWDKSIEICHSCHVKGNLFVSDYLPRTLPIPDNVKFSLIIAFSVFTHLSKKATEICLETFREKLTDDGLVAITIRPVDYWNIQQKTNDQISDDQIKEMILDHEEKGFAFLPHNRKKVEGEVTYGHTSMTTDFLKNNIPGLDVVDTVINEIDPHQTIVFLRKKNC